MKRITRWRVSANIPVAELADVLNRREQEGWEIRNVFAQSAFRYTVISSRRVRVREKE